MKPVKADARHAGTLKPSQARKFFAGSQTGGFERVQRSYDVCVVGGGLAGLCAALASARGGARTVLVQDRPVLGGNASSEVRMWICGARGRDTREAGILEEIQLTNCHRNPYANYSLWDSVLYEKAAFCPNLTLMLNTSCLDAVCEGGRIQAIEAWQMSSQLRFTIEAELFIDCSGDSVLAPLSGALHRWGRESREEFGEDIQPEAADGRTMGNSLLLQLRNSREPEPFIPPCWAYRFDDSDVAGRVGQNGMGHNFWWMEVGGINDTIRDAEAIRHELMCIAYGVWDYFKNRSNPEIRAKVEPWSLEWVGSVPGKRENRRYVGPQILTQRDIAAGGASDDIVAYGGWPMDDHHPAGLLYPGKATLFHPAPSPYGIPFGCLYSANVDNLLFAGRNISVTHAALSSTRVMGTTSLLGQAGGTAAALCIRHRCSPAALHASHIRTLQAQLMDDDCWLPGLSRPMSEPTRSAQIDAANEANLEQLFNGHDRSSGDSTNLWQAPIGEALSFRWREARQLAGLRLVLDSDLNGDKKMPYLHRTGTQVHRMPAGLLRAFRVEALRSAAQWETVYRTEDNAQRLVRIPLGLSTKALRLIPESSWGGGEAGIFSVDVLETDAFTQFSAPEGRLWRERVAEISTEDLAKPDKEEDERPTRVGA